MADLPPHAPYADVTVGDPVEIRVREEDGQLIADCEFREDTFGASIPLTGNDLEDKLAIDELIQGVAMLVWNELVGTPVFREQDEQWTARVEALAPWESMLRKPTQGWVKGANVELPEREVEPIGSVLGDADVAGLQLSQDEMAALVRGEIPEGLVSRLLEARSTLNLLESVASALDELRQRDDGSNAVLQRAIMELSTVRRRFQ